MREPIVTLTGRTGGVPALHNRQGLDVLEVRLAVTKSVKDPTQQSGWRDVRTSWYSVTWFGIAAAQTDALGIGQGDTIRVTGTLYADDYQRRDGSWGTTFKLEADGTPRVWPRQRLDEPPAGGVGGWQEQGGGGDAPFQ